MSAAEYTIRKAFGAGERDAAAGLPCNPGRHSARSGGAWATWYRHGYEGKLSVEVVIENWRMGVNRARKTG